MIAQLLHGDLAFRNVHAHVVRPSGRFPRQLLHHLQRVLVGRELEVDQQLRRAAFQILPEVCLARVLTDLARHLSLPHPKPRLRQNKFNEIAVLFPALQDREFLTPALAAAGQPVRPPESPPLVTSLGRRGRSRPPRTVRRRARATRGPVLDGRRCDRRGAPRILRHGSLCRVNFWRPLQQPPPDNVPSPASLVRPP